MTKGAEIMRVLFGEDQTEEAASVGYYCQACLTQPKYECHWTKAQGQLFCANCGEAYDVSRMARLFTLVDKSNPDGSFVMNTKMLTGKFHLSPR